MSTIDKVTGRIKQAAGDLAGDSSLSREGRREERKGEAKEELSLDKPRVEDKAQEVAELSANVISSAPRRTAWAE